ncbi:MAG: BPTI/Kunitz domain-containing protein [Deltaproteobacteria bacterium]|nr:BPTI/Kunitz domain-containing protein [Deltaproteobacteria bacterium]
MNLKLVTVCFVSAAVGLLACASEPMTADDVDVDDDEAAETVAQAASKRAGCKPSLERACLARRRVCAPKETPTLAADECCASCRTKIPRCRTPLHCAVGEKPVLDAKGCPSCVEVTRVEPCPALECLPDQQPVLDPKTGCFQCPPNLCGVPIDRGPCDAFVPRWGLDGVTGLCKPFVYGGCGGNSNNFVTHAECAAACGLGACGLPLERGPCNGAIARWGRDSVSGLCKPFFYGGCGGNANNFASETECRASCGLGACDVALDPGPCDGAVIRWGRDAATGLCTRFVYGGCGGNANNFETQAACEAACPR